MIEFVFFDAGETLLSPNPSWAELSARVLRSRGHEVEGEAMQDAWRDFGSRFREATDSGVQFSLDTDRSRTFWTTLYRDILGHLRVDDAEAPEILYTTFSKPENYTLFRDSRGCLEALHARGMRTGVISNFESWLEKLLEHLGVSRFFEVIAISGHLGWEKPDPRIFEWAVEQAGVAPAACVVVGDQPYFDSDPAEALGMHGVLLDRFGRYDALTLTYPRIRSLSEVNEVVARMSAG